MNAVCMLIVLLTSPAEQAPVASNPTALVHELGTFRDALPAGAPSHGRVSEVEARRAAVYRELRVLDSAAAPALTRGLADADVRVRRGVALYLLEAGGNYSRIAPRGLDLTSFLHSLVQALRDPDQRVKELSAQAVGVIGPAAAVAVPELVRLLADPAEGLRNSACIGLAGIGPAARDALPALRKALADSSPDVRQFAQSAIHKIEARPQN
jgi:HEAT repeat protein